MKAKMRALCSSASDDWPTPKALYEDLDSEFHFNFDPCPLHGKGGLEKDWGTSTYVNPPFGRQIGKWMEKAYTEAKKGKVVVCLVPSRTDAQWWHSWVLRSSEVRFVLHRLRAPGQKWTFPFPSAIIVFTPFEGPLLVTAMKGTYNRRTSNKRYIGETRGTLIL